MACSPAGAPCPDNFFYFDTCTDPAYIAMWRNDRPFGAGSVWPPLGELGGVGVFTVLLTIGAGVALGLAWRRTVVIGIGFVIVGAWLVRMLLAGQMYATNTVRLYPRTTMVVLYGLLLLTGLAVFFVSRGGPAVPDAAERGRGTPRVHRWACC